MAEAVYLGVGRRKTAVARVRMKSGTGIIKINKKIMDEYFTGHEKCQIMLMQPLALSKLTDKYDIQVRVNGGGLSGQAEAIKHGIARALVISDESLRPLMKKAGYLTRDSRMVERKKPGQPKARKKFQFSKR